VRRFTGSVIACVALLLLLPGLRPARASDEGIARARELAGAFRSVYERVAPAVVLIRTSTPIERRLPSFHPPIDPEGGHPDFTGLGSGVIVSPDGYILSNHHVIQKADSIEVTLQDRRRLIAHVVGVDSLIDIALLKIDAQDLPTAPLGQSDDLQIGDWVLAIGFPLGMGTTLTHGIVSALGRQAEVIRSDLRIESFIQTNAVINPGNSGGPLLDLDGRIVGINTAISTKTGYYIGYGLAVPANLAREAMEDFLEYGRVVRGYLGIAMQKVDAALVRREQLALQPPRGVFLSRIDDDTPAASSALRVGDVLLAVEDRPVNEPNEVQTLIYGRDPGDAIRLRLHRNGAEQVVTVVLGERENDQVLALGHRRIDRLGLTVAGLDPARAAQLGFDDAIARDLGLSDSGQGVVIVDLDPSGPAADLGLRIDDIITEVDRTPVTAPDVFLRSVAALEGGSPALFWFWRPDAGVEVRALPIRSR
jgi:serine protease Do